MKRGLLKDLLKTTWLYLFYERWVGNYFFPWFVLKWFLRDLLARPGVIRQDGVCFQLIVNNWITHFRWFLFEKKEPEVRYFIKKYVRSDDVFFDIGANVGVFSIYAALTNPDLEVHCVEPEPSNCQLLKDNLLLNRLSTRVIINSIGVSDVGGLSDLWLQDVTPGAALHVESRKKTEITTEGNHPIVSQIGIYATSIDEYSEFRRVVPNWLKIDTDGNELKILTGARAVLAHDEFFGMIIEMPPDQNEADSCRQILEANNLVQIDYPYPVSRNQIWVKDDSQSNNEV